MHRITHSYASRGWVLAPAIAAALALAVAPGTARAQVPAIAVGHAAVAGTLTYADGPSCPAETIHEDAVAVGAVDDPVGTYAGPLSITADGTSNCFGLSSLAIDTGSFTVTVSGSDATGSVVCRDYTSPASAPAPMPGLWFRIGEILILGADGICNINGSDSVHEQVWQTLVFAPTGASAATLRYTGGSVSGDLRIGT